MLKALLAAGADKNVLHEQMDMTALQLATKNGQLEVMAELLDNKAKVNARSKEHGMTALHVYVSSGLEDLAVMDLLLKSGAKVNAKDFNGVAPLHLAVYTENNAAIERLSSAGANMNVCLPKSRMRLCRSVLTLVAAGMALPCAGRAAAAAFPAAAR